MIEQDLCQITGGILEQCIHSAVGQGLEGGVGGGKNGKRTFTAEVIVQFSGYNGCFQGIVIGASDDNIHYGRHRNKYRIDDMDHPVTGMEIGTCNIGIVDQKSMPIR